jgi:hypothetical protein
MSHRFDMPIKMQRLARLDALKAQTKETQEIYASSAINERSLKPWRQFQTLSRLPVKPRTHP